MARRCPAPEREARTSRPIGAVGEHLETGLLTVQERDPGLAVVGVGRSEGGGGDDPGLGLDGDVRLVAVAVLRARLVHVARLRVDGRDDPVRGHFAGDPPGAVLVLFDVLAGDERQQSEGARGLRGFGDVIEGGQDRQRVLHQGVDQLGPGDRVVPGDQGLALGLVVVGAHHHLARPGDHPAHPADGRDELGDGVLGGHRVVEQGRVEGPAVLALQDPGGFDDRANGVEDALGTSGLAQSRAPVGEDRVVEPLIIESQPAGHLPADPVPKRPGGVAVRKAFQGLEDHDRGHHIGGDRWPPTPGREQVLEHLVGEQLVAVIGQKGLDAAIWDELAAQGRRVEKLTVGVAVSLHPPILDDRRLNREYRTAICSTGS
jgi:hypothetical protein